MSRVLVGRRRAAAAAALALVVVLAACSGGSSAATAPAATAPAANGAGATTATPGALSGTVNVFAAASLTDAFAQIGKAFEAAHPGVRVVFNFAGSSALATQIEQGAPADVFASANTDQMQRLVTDGLMQGAPQVFVHNMPVIVVPADNPAGVQTAADLAKPHLRLVLALADVPIGQYARQVLAKLGADPAYGPAFRSAALRNVVSSESDVRAVLAKVELGEADAGIVYRTDAAVGGDKVKTIAIPASANVVADYPIGVVRDAASPAAAAAFIAYVEGPRGEQLLSAAGFSPAP